jgi:hypothetical protein
MYTPAPNFASPAFRQVRKTAFGCLFVLNPRAFYQDRLGTNIGKVARQGVPLAGSSGRHAAPGEGDRSLVQGAAEREEVPTPVNISMTT